MCSLLRRFREGGGEGCCIIKRGIDAYCLNDWVKSRSEVRMHLSTVGVSTLTVPYLLLPYDYSPPLSSIPYFRNHVTVS